MKTAIIVLLGIVLLGCAGLGGGTPIDDDGLVDKLSDAEVPIHCTITDTSVKGQKTTSEFWRKNDKTAVTTTTVIKTKSKETPSKVEAKLKNKYYYVSTQDAALKCKWQKTKATALNLASAEYIENFIGKKGIKIKCFEGGFGDNVFDTPGKVCSDKQVKQELEALKSESTEEEEEETPTPKKKAKVTPADEEE